MFNRIYVHIPFCIKKCNYCAFYSKEPQGSELKEYPELLLSELKLHKTSSKTIDSIYFGGGTPSLLQPSAFAILLENIARRFHISNSAEITMEVNPGTVDLVSIQNYRKAGINRISLGVQSFDDYFCKLLGRIHTVQQSLQAFADIRKAGFNNVSIDLMHSLPGQTLKKWRTELEQVIKLEPEHISVYGLTIEEGTPFEINYMTGSQEIVNEDLSADMFELADRLLTAADFEHYEIANYAKCGHQSEHNSGYWKRDGYLGLGVAAHSFFCEGYGVRFNNPNTLNEYRKLLLSGTLHDIKKDSLTMNEAISEYMFLGLRMAAGIDSSAFELTFKKSLKTVYGEILPEIIKLGLIVQNDNSIKLTKTGMLLSNQVFSRLLI